MSKPEAQRFNKRSYLFKTVPCNMFTSGKATWRAFPGWDLMQENSTKRTTQLRSRLVLLPQAEALILEEHILYWVRDEEAKAL